jgi:hypothetical protein
MNGKVKPPDARNTVNLVGLTQRKPDFPMYRHHQKTLAALICAARAVEKFNFRGTVAKRRKQSPREGLIVKIYIGNAL